MKYDLVIVTGEGERIHWILTNPREYKIDGRQLIVYREDGTFAAWYNLDMILSVELIQGGDEYDG